MNLVILAKVINFFEKVKNSFFITVKISKAFYIQKLIPQDLASEYAWTMKSI